MKRLETEWVSYKAMAVPFDAEKYQLDATRAAFYAGATALWDVLFKEIHDPQRLLSQSDYDVVEKLATEIRAYKEHVSRGIV